MQTHVIGEIISEFFIYFQTNSYEGEQMMLHISKTIVLERR
jgi:hypothetical protein